MNVPLDEVIHFDAITTTPSTGAAVDADAAPTFAVYEEATDTDIGVGGNMTKRTSLTGNYRGTFTLSAANGFEVGKWYSIIATGVVGGVTGKAVLKNFRVVAAEAVAGKVKVDVDAWLGTAAATPTVAGVPEVDVTHFNGTAGTFSSGRPEVNSTHWAGSAITATSIPVGTAAGAAGGLFISGSNSGTTTFGALTVTGATTLTGAVSLGSTLGVTGTTTFAALTVSGATTLTGNVSMAAGLTITQSSADTSAIVVTGNGTGDGIRATGGATGRGIAGVGGATSGDGIVGTSLLLGHGIRGIGVGSARHGIVGQASTNASGLSLAGAGTGHGILIAAGASGLGISVDTITTSGAVTFASFTPNYAAGSITAAVIATDAIDADAIATNAREEIADQVWDELIAGHAGVGSTGAALSTAASAGDPWTTALPGAYGAGTAGFIIGTNINATITSRATPAQVNTEVVDGLAVDVIADSVPADGIRPTIAQALYMIVQFLFERAVSGTTVTVKKPDGSTSLMTLTLNDATTPTSITRAT